MFEKIKKVPWAWNLMQFAAHYDCWQKAVHAGEDSEKIKRYLRVASQYGDRVLELSRQLGIELPEEAQGYIAQIKGINETSVKWNSPKSKGEILLEVEVDKQYEMIARDLGEDNSAIVHGMVATAIGNAYDQALEAIQERPDSPMTRTLYVENPRIPGHLAKIVEDCLDGRTPLEQTQSLIRGAKTMALAYVTTLAPKD